MSRGRTALGQSEVRVPVLPQTLTASVDEVAAALGVGRAALYGEVRRTGTCAGIPVVRVGRLVRVPTAPLRRLLSLPEAEEAR